MLAAMYMK
ncbi:hypothetical protein D4764_21G0006400 [Takifugu flavidus]|uniref:Uncharacterized protein n=1 Tax=Takifugu flavidus TaxID=433684 RepID=A0A5C6NI74_9TELE|nr:hypothetical protein D4764_21G0006400 [Takifugu flavidus]